MSVLFSKGVSGEDNKVYLLSLDNQLQQLSQVETPLRGWLGRTYQLISSPRGHLAIGDGPEQRPRILVEFDSAGKLIWEQAISAEFSTRLVPFRSGFYVVGDVSEDGMDVEKYLY